MIILILEEPKILVDTVKKTKKQPNKKTQTTTQQTDTGWFFALLLHQDFFVNLSILTAPYHLISLKCQALKKYRSVEQATLPACP